MLRGCLFSILLPIILFIPCLFCGVLFLEDPQDAEALGYFFGRYLAIPLAIAGFLIGILTRKRSTPGGEAG